MIDGIATNLSFLPLKFSRNKLAHTIEGADPALVSRANLKYFLTLMVPEYPFSTNMVELHTSEGREKPVTSESGVSVFSGAEFRFNNGRNGKIDGLLSYSKPRWKQAEISVSLSQTTAFSLTEQISGGLPELNVSQSLAKQYAIKAGLSNDDFYAYADNFWNVYQSANRKFLTWVPDYKIISRQQEEYLSFLINFMPKPEKLRLRMQWYTLAGAPSDAVTVLSLSSPLLYSIVTCPVGPAVMAVPTNAASYEVWLCNEQNFRVSETRTFLIDDHYTPQERHVLFVNSLGGWDTLRLTGEGQRSLKVQQAVAAVERPADAGVDFSELRIVNIEGENEFTAGTGNLHRDMGATLKYFNELLLSEQVFLITDKGHKPLQVTSTSLVDQQDNTDLVSRSFTFRALETIENFSELPAAQPAVARTTTWRGIGLHHILDAYGKRTGLLAFARLEKVYADNYTAIKPYTVKANVQGDPDYQPPIRDNSIIAGSTLYPSAAINRAGSYDRTTCGVNFLGGKATIIIGAGKYGGEAPGDADALAEAEFKQLDSQSYADTNGSCTQNIAPVFLNLQHQMAMDASLRISGSGDYGPVVALLIKGDETIPNTVGVSSRISEESIEPGLYDIICRVTYVLPPYRSCKLRLPAKNRELIVSSPGYYQFNNIQINSADTPLAVQIIPNL